MFLGLMIVIATGIVLFAILEYQTYRTPDMDAGENASLTEKRAAALAGLDELEAQGRFNGTILYAEKDTILLERSMGRVNAGSDEAFTARASFNLASVSKHFTGFSILKLAYEGQLSLVAPVKDYIPELHAYPEVTIKHLLYHSSGVPDYIRMSKRYMQKGEVFTIDMLLSWLGEGKEKAYFQPGEKDDYSNTGYVLLAEVVARVSGKSYADYMRDEIFAPLEMNDTYVVNQLINQEVLKQRVFGFRKKWLYFGEAVPFDLNHLDGAAGDGNIYSSARDLLKWHQSLRDGTLLPVEYYNTAYLPARLKDGSLPKGMGEMETWGIGWGVSADKKTVYAYGGWAGFNNHYRRDLENDIMMIVLSNAGFLLRTATIGDKLYDAMR